MANKTRIRLAKDQIKNSLARRKSHTFSSYDLNQIYKKNKDKWILPKNMSIKKFISSLLYEEVIGECILNFGEEEKATYYLYGSHEYYVICSLMPNTYLSHGSALRIWLQLNLPEDKIFINKEQSHATSKSKAKILSQIAIDKSFAQQQRESSVHTLYNKKRVYLLSGKNSKRLGITKYKMRNKEVFWVANLERTLIDCIVRPSYGYSPKTMIEVFKLANEKISIDLLLTYLDELNYTYPYHQATGFYLDYAGVYPKKDIDKFLGKVSEYNFYLDYGMTDTKFSEKWKIYYPLSLDS